MSDRAGRHADLRALFSTLAGHDRHDPHDPLVRLAVRLRARDACEYCLHPTTSQYQLDHIIPPAHWSAYIAGRVPGFPAGTRHGGPDHLDNFAWSCPFCNGRKGQRISRQVAGRPRRLFNPRTDRWRQHFAFLHGFLLIVGVTETGRVTEETLGFNIGGLGGPLGPRHEAILAGRYPPSWARGWAAPT